MNLILLTSDASSDAILYGVVVLVIIGIFASLGVLNRHSSEETDNV